MPQSCKRALGKCTEYFVNQNLMEYITDNNILSDRQFGFRKDNSTTYLILADSLMDSVFLQNYRHSRCLVLFKSLLYDLLLFLRSCQQISVLLDRACISLCLIPLCAASVSKGSLGDLLIVLEM